MLALATSGACKRPADQTREGGGVVASRLSLVGPAASPVQQSLPGDWQLASDTVRLVVSATGTDRAPAGAIVDLALIDQPATGDELLEHAPVLYQGSQELPLHVQGVSSVLRDGRPALRIERRTDGGALAVWTEIGLVRGRRQVELHHRVYNRTRQPVTGLRLGERTRFAVTAVFVPEVGFVDRPTTAAAPWIAWRGRACRYGLLWPDRPAEVNARFEPHGPLDQVTLGSPFDLAPGAHQTDRRLLLIDRQGLAAIAERAWQALNVRHGFIRGRLLGPAISGEVEARLSERGPSLVVPIGADGQFSLPLPAAQYRVSVRSSGGEDVHVVSVTADQVSELREVVAPRPGFLRFRVRDEGGQPIAARLVIRGVPPTRDPTLGPAHLAAGAGNVVYTADGSGEIPLPAGRFVIAATHGPEYGVARQRVEIGRGRGTSVRFTLEREVESMGWLAAELHLHAEASPDSEISLRDRVTSLLAEGVELAVATDHNHVTDYAPAVAELSAGDRLAAIAGIEVTTWRPLWGHFNVFPYPIGGEVPATDGLAADRLFAGIRERAPGSIIQVNHPRMGDIGYFNRAALDVTTGAALPGYSPDFDCIEVWNGMDLAKSDVLATNLAEWYGLLNQGLRYTGTGSSDSHRLLYQWAGYPRTYLQIDDDRPAAITGAQVAQALRAGRAFVSSGPLLIVRVNGAGPGETALARDGQVHLQVSVRAASWIDVSQLEVVLNGAVAHRQAITSAGTRAVRAVLSRSLALTSDAWIVVVVRGERTLDELLPFSGGIPAAFSNPVFIDADGDGQVRLPSAAASGHAGDASDGGRATPAPAGDSALRSPGAEGWATGD